MVKDVSQEEQSEFNSAIASLKRLDVVKQRVDDASFEEDYITKWKALKVYYMELISFMSDKDDEKYKQKFKETRLFFNELQSLIRQGQKTVPTKLIDAIDDWEIELRNIEQSYGLNMTKKADPRYALASR